MRSPLLTVALVVLALVVPATFHASSAAGSPVAPAFTLYPAPGGLGISGGEPSLGLDLRTGAVFVQALAQTLRVSFDDATRPAPANWQNVASPLAPGVNNDPIAFTDAATGRTFAGGLEGDCSALFSTDDDGGSWSPVGDACASPAFDHPTIASGPWRAPAPLGATSSRAVYYCAQYKLDECSVSLDGGTTFLPPTVLNSDAKCTNLFGHVKVASDGVVYVPVKNCGVVEVVSAAPDVPLGSAQQGLFVSTDNGLTWTTRVIPDSTVPARAFDPQVATTPSGWVYAAWQASDNHASVALSKDHGATWTASADVGASVGVRAAAFVAPVAGDDERAAVAFLGTTDPGDAFAAGFQGTWDLYVATTQDAGVTWSAVKVTADPVQRGWICTMGIFCPNDPSTLAQRGRNLLDFIDAGVDARGRVVVAFADGCLAACAAPDGTPAESTSQLATIARQTCGPSLFAAQGEVEGAGACPTSPPPQPPVPLHQAYAYVGGVGDITCATAASHCYTFAVPAGTGRVALSIMDHVVPDVGGYWCIDSCAASTGFFCDATSLDVPKGTSAVIVVVDPEGLGVIPCLTSPPGAGVAGEVSADFAPR